MGLLHFGSKRDGSNGSELGHPRLISLKLETRQKPVEVINGENGGEGREGVMGIDLQHPLDGASSGGGERRVGLKGFEQSIRVLPGEQRNELIVFPKQVVVYQNRRIGSGDEISGTALGFAVVVLLPVLLGAIQSVNGIGHHLLPRRRGSDCGSL